MSKVEIFILFFYIQCVAKHKTEPKPFLKYIPSVPNAELVSRAFAFSKKWENASNEKRESQNFLRDFLGIFGIALVPSEHFEYEVCKNAGDRGYIDCLVKKKIAIEMKSRGENLGKAFGQLKEYVQWLPEDFIPEILMVCDFETIILDFDKKKIEFNLADLYKRLDLFNCLLGKETDLNLQEQMEANIKAAEKMSMLHDALKNCGYAGKALEVYLVRLLFCLFAEDSSIFPKYSFLKYIEASKKNGSDLSEKIARLFEILNTPNEARKRKTNLPDELLEYVNQQNLEPLKEGLINAMEVVKDYGAKRIEELEKIKQSFNPDLFGKKKPE